MGMNRSFRLQAVDYAAGQMQSCKSSILLSETISDDCNRITAYERLSQSMGFSDFELSHGRPRKKKQQIWVCITWVFSMHGHGDRNQNNKEDATAVDSCKLQVEKKKRHPSWLPDPDRRWPIQGW
ncbi:hypothetical protein NE237_022131 [Protea cynaroides]|uniref:Uncharacterized protein n=1 Tax=Protea cynaroides TaxID=273540 RepID=A0A9Q0K464_9MAGN|nr:hypothetical protein NE237_022131 [Protea cynaroides]